MKNTYTTPADFWKERDFGAKISATFEFIGVHWKPLGKCLLYFVLPFALLMGIGLGLFTNSIFNQMGGVMAAKKGGTSYAAPSSPFGMFNLGGIALGFVSGLLSFLLLVSTLLAYLRARLHLAAEELVTPSLVWAEIKARIGRMLLVVVLLGAAYLALVVGFSLLMTAVGGGLDSVAAVMLSVLLLFALMAYLGVTLSLFFPILWVEDQPIFAAVARSFGLIRGRWWPTFGLLAVAGLIQSMLAIVFIIPQYAVMFGKMMQVPALDSDVLGLLAQCIYAVGIIFTNVVPLLALAFQYFHLVEQKEGFGLRLLVDELGQPQAIPLAQSSHYQPDDEGEY